MEKSLKTIIDGLVDNKEAVSIKEKEENHSIIFEVQVANEDMGKVIGREGKIAKSIRTIMKALGAKEGKKVMVEFVD